MPRVWFSLRSWRLWRNRNRNPCRRTFDSGYSSATSRGRSGLTTTGLSDIQRMRTESWLLFLKRQRLSEGSMQNTLMGKVLRGLSRDWRLMTFSTVQSMKSGMIPTFVRSLSMKSILAMRSCRKHILSAF